MAATENEREPEPRSAQRPDRQPVRCEARQIDSNDLLQGEREVHIRHEGDVYRLRVTRNGKLILHK